MTFYTLYNYPHWHHTEENGWGEMWATGIHFFDKGLALPRVTGFFQVRLLSRQTDARQMHRNQIPDRG